MTLAGSKLITRALGRPNGPGDSGDGPSLVGRTIWSAIAEILQLASSVLVFLILARHLAPADYGVMGAVLGLAMPAATLTSFGSHVLLIKRVAQGGSFKEAWQQATSIGILGPALGAIVMIAFKPVLLPGVDIWVYTLLLLSQLNFFWLTELAVHVGGATRNFRASAQIRLMIAIVRFGALIVFAALTPGRLIDWAIASAISFALSAALAIGYIWRVFDAPPSLKRGSFADAKEGAPFSANAVTGSLVDTSDRPLLYRYGHESDAGIYALGGRIVQFGYMPVRILLRASDADLFAAGQGGIRPALQVVKRLLRPAMALGVLSGACLLLGASIVPRLVGSEYEEAVLTIQLFATMPAIRALQYLVGNCLSASGHQRVRLLATVAAAVLNFGLNLVLLRHGSWRMAVVTTFVTEIFLTLVLVVVVAALYQKEQRYQKEPGR
jgi:O-antigen/teichoic acid export membrane protein